jgi:hypothetical protein
MCNVCISEIGGGLGGTRRGGADVNIKHSGREDNERERERYRLEQHRDRDRESEYLLPQFNSFVKQRM